MSVLEASIIVDDKSIDRVRYKAVHGLAIYIEYGRHFILFDTGPNSDVIQHNSESMGIDLSLLDFVIVSHQHSSHIGGLPYIGWVSPSIKTYIPYASGLHLEQIIRRNGLVPVEVMDWTSLDRDVYITKPFHGPPWEHYLVFKTPNGLIVFSGCCHTGVEKVVSEIIEWFNDSIYAFIGGLHLSHAPDSVVYKAIDWLADRAERIVPLHCSGERVLEYMSRKYSDKLLTAMAGSTISL